MSNIVPCVADCNAKFIEGLDSALEMDLAVSDDAVESSLSQKTANTLDSTGSPAVDGFQDRKGSDDPLGAFEPQPVVPFSKRPPKAVEDIYNSLPSVESLFPDWPFYPLELPQSIPKMLTWRDAEMLRRLQGWNKEISLTRVHAPGTAAHRLWNHSFEQDVKDFSEEYEAYRRNGFQTLPGEQKIANERSMPYTFGKAFKCSICEFSPRHDDIPNWLYYTKLNENSPRYFYCLRCKGRERDTHVKSFSNLMAVVEEIVAICHAEENAKVGMDNVITSVPLVRFKRYEIMFSIEVEAAMVRGAIKAAETRQLEKISGDFGFSAVGKAVANGVMDHYSTTEIPRLFDTRDQPEHLGSSLGEGSHTPPGWPRGYIPRVVADNVDPGNVSLNRPPTPVWFTGTTPACPSTSPGYPQWHVPLDRTLRSSTPPGYPEWFTPRPPAPYEEPDMFTDATNARCSIIQPEVHVPFRDFSAFVHPENSSPGDHTPPEYPEGATTWLTHPGTPLGSPEPLSSPRSSRTLYEDYTPHFDVTCDTRGSSARSSVTLLKDFGQQLADPVVERSPRRLLEIPRNRPPVDSKQKSKGNSLPDPGHPLRRYPDIENKSHLLSQGGIPARLPPKTERIPPARNERASYYKYNSEADFTPFYGPSQPAAQISQASFFNNITTEAQPLPRPDRATLYKYKPDAAIPPKIERRSLYSLKNHNIESTARAFSHESLSSIAEEKLEDHPESDFNDISADWDSDESFEPPRRLRCLDLLDELIPPRRDEYTGCNSRKWNSRPMGKWGRNVDLSLNSILENIELEDSELEERELEERGPEKTECVQHRKIKGKRVDRERA